MLCDVASLTQIRALAADVIGSKVMAWVAFDRGIKAIARIGLDKPRSRWCDHRERLHAEICARGSDPRHNAFTRFYGSSELDASPLMMSLVGLLPPADPRIKGTDAAIERELMDNGFARRFRTSDGGEVGGLEAVFLPWTFWLADTYVLLGRRDDAEEVFERLLSVANDVGLLAEQYDPTSKRLLGNFPQAFSHVSLINSAPNLTRARGPAEHRKES